MKINERLKQLREERGFSQYDVAKKLKTNQAQISRIESGQIEIKTTTLHRICKLYGVPPQIVVWQSIEEKDIQPKKKEVFNKLRPLVDNLISEMLK